MNTNTNTNPNPLAGVGAAGWELAETHYMGDTGSASRVTKTEEWVHPASHSVVEIGYTRDGDMVTFELYAGDAGCPGLAAAVMVAFDEA